MDDPAKDSSRNEKNSFDDDDREGVEGSSKGKTAAAKDTLREGREEMSRTLVEDTFKYERSYSRGIAKSVHQQAAEEPDFVGEAYYYNLNEPGVQKLVAGQYVIVFARKVDQPAGSERQYEVFQPNAEENCFRVYTAKPDKEHPDSRHITEILNAGNLAALSICVNDQELEMRVAPPVNRKWANAIIMERETVRKNQFGSQLERLLGQEHLLPTGSWIAFGLRMGDAKDSKDQGIPPGFEFANLTLGYFDPYTRTSERLEVIAVKIPEDRDVGSAFLLRQEIPTPRKWEWWIFPGDDRDD